MLLEDLIIAQAILQTKLSCQSFYQFHFLLNRKITCFYLLNVKLNLIERLIAGTKQIFNTCHQVFLSITTVILPQKISLLNRSVHLRPKLHFFGKGRKKMVKLFTALVNFYLIVCQQASQISNLMDGGIPRRN